VQVGAMLARMHVAGASFSMQQPHLRGLAWWRETVPVVLPHLQAEEPARAALLRDELAFQRAVAASAAGAALPRGPIHADLFRDNVMFDDTAGDDRLCGFFDFYFAGTDALLFDIAVCLNDWCCDLDTGRLDETRAEAFVAAYAAVRPLTCRPSGGPAGSAARRGAALLALAPVGLAPAAPGGAAGAEGPAPLRARAARTHRHAVASADLTHPRRRTAAWPCN
jgi:hypothetical protein